MVCTGIRLLPIIMSHYWLAVIGFYLAFWAKSLSVKALQFLKISITLLGINGAASCLKKCFNNPAAACPSTSGIDAKSPDE